MNNGAFMQFFHWYINPDGTLWNELKEKSKELAQAGFTGVWIPPSYKGQGGGYDVGYGVYDLFDLGEFEQKGTTRTKYGTKAQLLAAIAHARSQGIQVYADVVFNHKDGADEIEKIFVQEVDWNDRNRIISDWYQINAYTKFNFPGRGNTHSSMKWNWECFDSLSYNADSKRADKLYRLKDKNFETDVNFQHGNYDYLMANDLDMSSESVRQELMSWGKWYIETTGVNGFRLDAIKHIRASFFRDWLGYLKNQFPENNLFTVGEYWSTNIDELHGYVIATEGQISLFDVPLHYKFHHAGRAGSNFDLRTIFDRTLVKEQPTLAVTFVENHDTQPCQSLETPVEPWFKPLAYALILLWSAGYPCVFYADYYGANYKDKDREATLYSHRFLIDRFLWARQNYGYGDRHDYFDHPNTIAWMRLGDREHPGAMAVVMSNGSKGNKWMNTFRPNATFYDCTEHIKETVTTNKDGWGDFRCNGGSVSVWLQK
ncbi:MAG: alpha-amylase [Xenococcaceae cyanobacterium]